MNIHVKKFVGTCIYILTSSAIKPKVLLVLTVSGLLLLTMSSYLPSSVLPKSQDQKIMAPFKGDYIVSITPLGRPPIQQLSVNGAGHATHLGKSRFEMSNTVNFTTMPFTLDGTATFYAANGDQIFTTVSGTSTPNSDGSATAVIENTITGGTGRFQNASGSFAGTTIATIGQPSIRLEFEGNIVY